MDERNMLCQRFCPCPALLEIVTSIAHQEDAISCILSAECAKINRVVSSYTDADVLIAIDTSAQATLDRLINLEGVLKAKLDSIVPLLSDCI